MIAVRQAVFLVGSTHASSVMPVVRRRSGASAIVTQSFLPSNFSALPCLPLVVQVASRIEPV